MSILQNAHGVETYLEAIECIKNEVEKNIKNELE